MNTTTKKIVGHAALAVNRTLQLLCVGELYVLWVNQQVVELPVRLPIISQFLI